MVSLGNHRNSTSGGYFDFTDDRPTINSNSQDDELIVDHIELVSRPEMVHKPIRTVWVIIFLKLLYIALGVSAYIVPMLCSVKLCGQDSISITLYVHGGMWFLLFALDRFLILKHREHRLCGYLDFYRRTRNVRAVPFFINSCANALMVVVTKLLDRLCDSNGSCPVLSKMRFVQILVSIECAAALVVLVVYLVKVIKFNREKALPDVTRDDMLTSFVNSHSSIDIGYRKENTIDQVMEKQADMIRYLRQHSESLARRNLALTEQVRQLTSGGGNNIHGHF